MKHQTFKSDKWEVALDQVGGDDMLFTTEVSAEGQPVLVVVPGNDLDQHVLALFIESMLKELWDSIRPGFGSVNDLMAKRFRRSLHNSLTYSGGGFFTFDQGSEQLERDGAILVGAFTYDSLPEEANCFMPCFVVNGVASFEDPAGSEPYNAIHAMYTQWVRMPERERDWPRRIR